MCEDRRYLYTYIQIRKLLPGLVSKKMNCEVPSSKYACAWKATRVKWTELHNWFSQKPCIKNCFVQVTTPFQTHANLTELYSRFFWKTQPNIENCHFTFSTWSCMTYRTLCTENSFFIFLSKLEEFLKKKGHEKEKTTTKGSQRK